MRKLISEVLHDNIAFINVFLHSWVILHLAVILLAGLEYLAAFRINSKLSF